MRCRVVVPPEPVVTWEEADEHLKLDGDTSEQAYVESLMAAAQGHIDGPDGWLGRAIGPQTIEARFAAFWNGALSLPFPPHIEIVSIQHADAAGAPTMVDALAYELDCSGLSLRSGYAWPYVNGIGAVRVRYRAGYDGGEGRQLPAPIRAAILIMVSDLYKNRGSTSVVASNPVSMPTTAESLLAPFRVWR